MHGSKEKWQRHKRHRKFVANEKVLRNKKQCENVRKFIIHVEENKILNSKISRHFVRSSFGFFTNTQHWQ